MTIASKNGCFGQVKEKAWNYGKTKETHPSIAKQSNKKTGRNKLSEDLIEELISLRNKRIFIS